MIIGRHNGTFFFVETRCPSMTLTVKVHDLYEAFKRKGGYYIYTSGHKLRDLTNTLPPEHLFRNDVINTRLSLSFMVGVEITENGDINEIWISDGDKIKKHYFRVRVSNVDWESDNFIIDQNMASFPIYNAVDTDALSAKEIIDVLHSDYLYRLDGVATKTRAQLISNADMKTALQAYYSDGTVPDKAKFETTCASRYNEVTELELDQLQVFNFESFQHGTPDTTS